MHRRMEFWYTGGEGCNPAVRDRNFLLSSGQPTILIGRNGSGKTLASTLYGVFREFFFAKKELPQKYEKLTAIIDSLGITSMGFTTEFNFLQVNQNFITDWEVSYGVDTIDSKTLIPPVLRQIIDDIAVPYCDTMTWETEAASYRLFANLHVSLHRMDDGTSDIKITIVPQCKNYIYIESNDEEFLDMHPEMEDAFAAKGDGFGTSIEFGNIAIEGLIKNKKSISDEVIAKLDLIEQKLAKELVSASVESYTACVTDLQRRVDVGVEEEFLHEGAIDWYEVEKGPCNSFDTGAVMLLVHNSFPEIKFLSVDRKWTSEHNQRVDNGVLALLIESHSEFKSKFDIDSEQIPIGNDMLTGMVPFSDLDDETFFPPHNHGSFTLIHLLPLPFTGYSGSVEDLFKFATGRDKNEAVSSDFEFPIRTLFDKYLTLIDIIDDESELSFSGCINALVHTVSTTEPLINQYRARLKSVLPLWKISLEENRLDEFIVLFLKYFMAEKFCECRSVETRSLFEIHKRITNSIALTDILSNPNHLPSGFQRLLSMIMAINDDRSLDDETWCYSNQFAGSSPYVLFIDEPELSLHIDWQVDLLQVLQNLMKRNAPHGSSLLVATHSPDIIQEHIERCVEFGQFDVV
jgi:energy-coupling factor transporter ATP-binding protein EcfA2